MLNVTLRIIINVLKKMIFLLSTFIIEEEISNRHDAGITYDPSVYISTEDYLLRDKLLNNIHLRSISMKCSILCRQLDIPIYTKETGIYSTTINLYPKDIIDNVVSSGEYYD